MTLNLADPDDRLEPQLVAAMWAAAETHPNVGLIVQAYKHSTQRSIAGNPLGMVSVHDPSIRRRTRLGTLLQKKVCYREEDYWEHLDAWGILTSYWRSYWWRRRKYGKPVPPSSDPVAVERAER